MDFFRHTPLNQVNDSIENDTINEIIEVDASGGVGDCGDTWVNSWLPRGDSWLQDGGLGFKRKQRTSAQQVFEATSLFQTAPSSIVSPPWQVGAHQGCRCKAAAGAHAHPTTFARYSSRFCRWQRATGLTALLPLHTIHITVEPQVIHLLTEANVLLVKGGINTLSYTNWGWFPIRFSIQI